MDEKRNGGEISSYLRTCSVHLHQELIAIFLIDHVNIYADVGIIACIPCKKIVSNMIFRGIRYDPPLDLHLTRILCTRGVAS